MTDKYYYTQEEVQEMLKKYDIPEQEFKDFITGQGCPVVEDKLCYFTDDVNRFFLAKTFDVTWPRVLGDMLKEAYRTGVQPTENTEKIAKVRVRMNIPMNKCPCHAKDTDRGCISDKCLQEIEEKGVCGCNCFIRRK